MNCGRSSSVEWKLPKLQRRVRFPSPAPPPPGYAPGGFVMPPRQARLASHALFYLPLAPSRSLVGAHPVQNSPSTRPSRAEPVQNSPSSQPSGRHRYKTPPAPPKWPISARFTPAGRTLYRSHHQQVEQGELCTARGADAGTKLPQHPQNGPFQHVLRQLGELYTACATNKPSREKKVPHQHPTSPTNAPLPQFRMQFYCMNFQQSPETLQSQRHEFKF